jgi:peroxiredoxin
MNRKFAMLLALCALILTATSAFAQTTGGTVGSRVADFTLTDVKGGHQSLASLKGKNGTVLVFLSARCPVVKAYNERIDQIAKDYKEKGITVVGINPNATEPSDEVKAHAAEHYSFNVLLDKGAKLADTLVAEHTPEVFLLNSDGVIVYRGRIDNSFDAATATKHDLAQAIDETLAGKPVAVTKTVAIGCTIKRTAE